MSKKALILSLLGILVIAVAIPLTVYLVRQQQIIKSDAQTASPSPGAQQFRGQESEPPDPVDNVRVEYPYCQGTGQLQCSFTQASCSWDSANGANSYNVKVTEVDTGSVIKTESVSSSTLQVVFPVVSGRTYQCDVTAVNAAGQSGGTGTDSLLCEVDGVFASPTPTPTPPPQATPPPTPPPTQAPQRQACGYSPCNSTTAPCEAGLVCVTANNGISYCAKSTFQEACKANPGYAACCLAPTPTPTPKPTPVVTKTPVELPKGGTEAQTMAIVIAGVLFTVVGGVLVWFTKP